MREKEHNDQLDAKIRQLNVTIKQLKRDLNYYRQVALSGENIVLRRKRMFEDGYLKEFKETADEKAARIAKHKQRRGK